jgi:hypothetical protein
MKRYFLLTVVLTLLYVSAGVGQQYPMMDCRQR